MTRIADELNTYTEKERKVRRERQLMEDWQAIAKTSAGRRVIADLLYWANVLHPIEENDPIAMARMIGERNLAIRISRYLTMSPDIFPDIMRANDEVQASWMGDKEYRQHMAAYVGMGQSN